MMPIKFTFEQEQWIAKRLDPELKAYSTLVTYNNTTRSRLEVQSPTGGCVLDLSSKLGRITKSFTLEHNLVDGSTSYGTDWGRIYPHSEDPSIFSVLATETNVQNMHSWLIESGDKSSARKLRRTFKGWIQR